MSEFFDSDQEFGSISAELMAKHSGMELLQDMIDGKLPAPTMARTLNFKLVEIADGVAVFKGRSSGHTLQPAWLGAWWLGWGCDGFGAWLCSAYKNACGHGVFDCGI